MKSVRTQVLQSLMLSCVIASALGINYLSAWTGPTALPPGNNAATPLNIGTTTQVKDGNMSVGSSANNTAGVNPLGFSVVGSQYINGWLKVGDGASGVATQPLELVGTAGTDGIKFPDGSVQTSAATSSVPSGMGGIYYIAAGSCFATNPATGACSCPAGYTSMPLTNVNGEGARDLYWCFKTLASAANYNFGGIYYQVGVSCFTGNPLNANACSCPATYTSVLLSNVNGEGGRDLYWCYK